MSAELEQAPGAEWCRLDGIDPATSKFPVRARVHGEGIIIVRSADGFRGVERSCPHLRATLMDSIPMSNGTMIRCAQHNFTFRLSDGKGINCPGYRLRVFEVKIEDGVLFARPTEHAAVTGKNDEKPSHNLASSDV
jgi:nitrite reductase/ring-hydroxylating ferredoxin subunit